MVTAGDVDTQAQFCSFNANYFYHILYPLGDTVLAWDLSQQKLLNAVTPPNKKDRSNTGRTSGAFWDEKLWHRRKDLHRCLKVPQNNGVSRWIAAAK